MLMLLIGIAIFMLFAIQSPELSSKFKRPDGFYDNMFEKVGVALLFASVGSLAFLVVKKLSK